MIRLKGDVVNGPSEGTRLELIHPHSNDPKKTCVTLLTPRETMQCEVTHSALTRSERNTGMGENGLFVRPITNTSTSGPIKRAQLAQNLTHAPLHQQTTGWLAVRNFLNPHSRNGTQKQSYAKGYEMKAKDKPPHFIYHLQKVTTQQWGSFRNPPNYLRRHMDGFI